MNERRRREGGGRGVGYRPPYNSPTGGGAFRDLSLIYSNLFEVHRLPNQRRR